MTLSRYSPELEGVQQCSSGRPDGHADVEHLAVLSLVRVVAVLASCAAELSRNLAHHLLGVGGEVEGLGARWVLELWEEQEEGGLINCRF